MHELCVQSLSFSKAFSFSSQTAVAGRVLLPRKKRLSNEEGAFSDTLEDLTVGRCVHSRLGVSLLRVTSVQRKGPP